MNDHEADLFCDELIIAFPAFKATAEKHSPDFNRTRNGWTVAWRDLSIGECREALRNLLVEGGISYENLQQPGPFIRRLVLEARKSGMQSERDRAVAIEREKSYGRKRDYQGSPMAAALVKSMEMRQQGASEAEILAAIEAAFPSANDYDGPRYRCLLCSDRGLVRVVRMDTMRKVQSLEIDAEKVNGSLTYMVACNCHSGRSVQERKPMQQSGKLPEFSEQNFCRWMDDGEDAARIADWVVKHKPKNYDDSFDNWHAGVNA
jgi:hypothetical protein